MSTLYLAQTLRNPSPSFPEYFAKRASTNSSPAGFTSVYSAHVAARNWPTESCSTVSCSEAEEFAGDDFATTDNGGAAALAGRIGLEEDEGRGLAEASTTGAAVRRACAAGGGGPGLVDW